MPARFGILQSKHEIHSRRVPPSPGVGISRTRVRFNQYDGPGKGGFNSAPTAEHLRLTEIDNPKPEVEVRTLDLVSTEDKASSCFLAMTTGPAGIVKLAK